MQIPVLFLYGSVFEYSVRSRPEKKQVLSNYKKLQTFYSICNRIFQQKLPSLSWSRNLRAIFSLLPRPLFPFHLYLSGQAKNSSSPSRMLSHLPGIPVRSPRALPPHPFILGLGFSASRGVARVHSDWFLKGGSRLEGVDLGGCCDIDPLFFMQRKLYYLRAILGSDAVILVELWFSWRKLT